MPGLESLLETPEPAALGPGPRSRRQSIPELEHALTAAFHGTKQTPREQDLVRALIFLWHDHLDEAHALAQDIATPDGSLIHAIMHRREPDYGNAKYWFHRVGRHACYPDIGKRAAAVVSTSAEGDLLERFDRRETWDPFAFVDCCQLEVRTPSEHDLFLRKVQKAEFAALLDYLSALH